MFSCLGFRGWNLTLWIIQGVFVFRVQGLEPDLVDYTECWLCLGCLGFKGLHVGFCDY